MGTRFKTFDSTGLAPNGRLYAGDLNQMQDTYADQSNLSQDVGAGTVTVGESALKLLRYGPGEARISGHLRTDGIFRGLGGLYAGAFTTTQRNAIAAGSRPYGLIILNTTTNQYEWNSGTDASPNWVAIAPGLGPGTITGSMLASNSVDSSKLVDGSVTYTDLDGGLKPSVSAAGGSEALRAIGGGAGQVVAGNDSRLTDTRVPTDGSVTNAKVAAGAAIAYSKLALGNSILNSDIVAAAGIPYSKLSLASSITAADIANALKPSAGASAATEALRALGSGANNAAAGNDSRLSDQRVPTDGSVTAAKIPNGTISAAHIADGNITTAKLGAGSVTYDKWAAGVGYMQRCGSDVVHCEGPSGGHLGWFSLTFPAPFPNDCIACIMGNGDANVELAMWFAINAGGKNRFGISGVATYWNGSAMGLVNDRDIRVEYVALGY